MLFSILYDKVGQCFPDENLFIYTYLQNEMNITYCQKRITKNIFCEKKKIKYKWVEQELKEENRVQRDEKMVCWMN